MHLGYALWVYTLLRGTHSGVRTLGMWSVAVKGVYVCVDNTNALGRGKAIRFSYKILIWNSDSVI